MRTYQFYVMDRWTDGRSCGRTGRQAEDLLRQIDR